MPVGGRRLWAFRLFGYSMAVGWCIGMWVVGRGHPLARRVITMVPALWITAGVVALDVLAIWQQRRYRRLCGEGVTIRAEVLRKVSRLGSRLLELGFVLDGVARRALTRVPGDVYDRLEPGSHLLVRVLPSDPSCCHPVGVAVTDDDGREE